MWACRIALRLRFAHGLYALVYRVHQDEIRIVVVFDSRQDPGRMNV
jgi:hypothetical protein